MCSFPLNYLFSFYEIFVMSDLMQIASDSVFQLKHGFAISKHSVLVS
jgi:hypothetical protein